MTTLSPDERADELRWIVRLVFAAGLVMGLCGREDLGLVAFVVAFVCWLFSEYRSGSIEAVRRAHRGRVRPSCIWGRVYAERLRGRFMATSCRYL